MDNRINPVSASGRIPAKPKKPIGPVCLKCGGYGYTQPKWKKGPRPPKTQCFTCKGKGRIG
ncbi:hypothetical protein [Roseobacter phage RDJL6]|nr:hypothetical protein [Roseobacter phage RDJL6]